MPERQSCFTLDCGESREIEPTDRMNETKISAPGADWTKLLTDPDIASHLGELLQAYRDAEPARRDEALRDTMRKIKNEAAKAQSAASSSKRTKPIRHPRSS